MPDPTFRSNGYDTFDALLSQLRSEHERVKEGCRALGSKLSGASAITPKENNFTRIVSPTEMMTPRAGVTTPRPDPHNFVSLPKTPRLIFATPPCVAMARETQEQANDISNIESQMSLTMQMSCPEPASRKSDVAFHNCSGVPSTLLEPCASTGEAEEKDSQAEMFFKNAGSMRQTMEDLDNGELATHTAKTFAKRNVSQIVKKEKGKQDVQEMEKMMSAAQFVAFHIAEIVSGVGYSDSKTKINRLLEPVMGFFVLSNVALLGVSIDYKDWDGWFEIDVAFTIIFTIEIVVRMSIAGIKSYAFGPDRAWNLFDFLLVCFSYVDFFMIAAAGASRLNEVEVLRVLRLFRIGRLLRVLRSPHAKDLIMFVRGMTGGFRTLLWSIVLLAMPVYVLGIVVTQTVGSQSVENRTQNYFRSVSMSMYTLLRCMVGDCTDANGKPIAWLLSEQYGLYVGYFYVTFMWVTIVGLFNLIAAVFVQNAISSAKSDEAFQRRLRQHEEDLVLRQIKELIMLLWRFDQSLQNQTLHTRVSAQAFAHGLAKKDIVTILEEARHMSITPELWKMVIDSEEARHIFDHLSIHDISEVFDIIDADCSGSLEIEELVEGILSLRGEAKKSDLIALNLSFRAFQEKTSKQNADFEVLAERMCGSLDSQYALLETIIRNLGDQTSRATAKSARLTN